MINYQIEISGFFMQNGGNMKEEVVELNVSDISDFPNHPFKINNDLNYEELRNSIIENKILFPTVVRKKMMGNMKCYQDNNSENSLLINVSQKTPEELAVEVSSFIKALEGKKLIKNNYINVL